ncbi:Nadph Oxidase 1 [Manis pentadactyla]|nr:Nadph Oxidase 1 [Manis pentadactyla]
MHCEGRQGHWDAYLEVLAEAHPALACPMSLYRWVCLESRMTSWEIRSIVELEPRWLSEPGFLKIINHTKQIGGGCSEEISRAARRQPGLTLASDSTAMSLLPKVIFLQPEFSNSCSPEDPVCPLPMATGHPDHGLFSTSLPTREKFPRKKCPARREALEPPGAAARLISKTVESITVRDACPSPSGTPTPSYVCFGQYRKAFPE